MSDRDRSAYRSYLLRLWRHSPHGPWCASLLNVSTGHTQHFARASELWAFLQAEMAGEGGQEADPVEPEQTDLRRTRHRG